MDFIFKEVTKLAVALICIDAAITTVSLVGGFFDLAVLFGMIYGFVFTELMFILLGTIVERALSMDERRAKKYMRTNYAIRFALTAVILSIPFFFDSINEWCVVLSMLAPKATYFTIGIYDNIKELTAKKK